MCSVVGGFCKCMCEWINRVKCAERSNLQKFRCFNGHRATFKHYIQVSKFGNTEERRLQVHLQTTLRLLAQTTCLPHHMTQLATLFTSCQWK